SRLTSRELDEATRARRDTLQAKARQAFALKQQITRFDRRRGEPLEARAAVDAILSTIDEAHAKHWRAVREDVDRAVQRHFCVRTVEAPAAVLPLDTYFLSEDAPRWVEAS